VGKIQCHLRRSEVNADRGLIFTHEWERGFDDVRGLPYCEGNRRNQSRTLQRCRFAIVLLKVKRILKPEGKFVKRKTLGKGCVFINFGG
jgi:hypothetical protein